ncbi:MAG: nicotinate-nucleotide adenylyltransferase [bacterium]
MRTGVLGGAFDPPHTGHLIVAEGTRDALALDRVLFIPYSEGPHRPSGPRAGSGHRLAMLEAALASEPCLTADDRELRRGDRSYTVDTLRSLADEGGGEELTLIVGSDQMLVFDEWKEAGTILELARVAVVERPGHPLSELDPEMGSRIIQVQLPLLLISSTDIRERVAAGRTIRHLVPEPVARYIQEHGLYRE